MLFHRIILTIPHGEAAPDFDLEATPAADSKAAWQQVLKLADQGRLAEFCTAIERHQEHANPADALRARKG